MILTLRSINNVYESRPSEVFIKPAFITDGTVHCGFHCPDMKIPNQFVHLSISLRLATNLPVFTFSQMNSEN